MRKTRNVALAGAALLLGLAVLGAPQIQAATSGSRGYITPVKIVSAKEAKGMYMFSPKKITIRIGTKVVFRNTTDTSHTVTSNNMKHWKFNKPLAVGKKLSFTFKKVGTFKFHCIPHQSMGMAGKIIVKP